MSPLATFSEQIVDSFAQTARKNQQRIGQWWEDITPDMNAVDPERMAAINKRRAQRCLILRDELSRELSATERGLKEAWGDASTRLEELSEFAEPGERKELAENVETAKDRFITSLTPQNRAKQDEMEDLLCELSAETGMQAMLDNVNSMRSSYMFPGGDSPPEKRILEVIIPNEWPIGTAYAVMHVINGALKEAGYQKEGSSHTGYKIYCDTDARTLSLITTDDTPHMDFEKLRQGLHAFSEKLAAVSLKPARSSKGVSYEYETTPDDRNPVTKIMHAILNTGLKEQEPPVILHKKRLNGRFLDNDPLDSDRDEAALGSANEVTRVSGSAIQSLLVDMLGIKGLSIPPKAGGEVAPH